VGVVAVGRRVGGLARDRGVAAVVADCSAWGLQWLRGRLGGRTGCFTYDGARVPYFQHPYNWTWMNERAVEIALAERVLAAHQGARVLEVGNVLAHYRPVRHEVVDKYEQAPTVRNVDVLEVTGAYDLIVSVSTLEHVGLDEDVRDPGKPVAAVRRLVGALAPGGTLWVSLPVGYNPDLDAAVRSGELTFDRLAALRREPRRNEWRQVPVAEVWDASYDRLVYTAHGLLVGEISAAPAPARPR
jgi:SAM-dependent methyltransferase